MSEHNKHAHASSRNKHSCAADVIKWIMVARLVDAFFSRIEEFHKPPRHPKWKEASISLTVPGWQRFKAADDWLARNRRTPSAEAERGQFEQFLADTGTVVADDPAKCDALFRQFLDWQKRRQQPAR